jgi:NTP pyrophosphatase (non-canonical NTP hydrolase)
MSNFELLDTEVRRLHDMGATHRKRGFKLNTQTSNDGAYRLIEEAKELKDEVVLYQDDNSLEEAADVLLVFLHLIQMQGWTPDAVIDRAFVKLQDIFPDGYLDTRGMPITGSTPPELLPK